MEEDIELIEKMIKEYKQFGDLDNPEFEDTDRIYKTIENLIKGYRELEKENKKYPIKLNDETYRKVIKNAQKDYIPISVIQNKIDELEHEKFKRTQLGVFLLKNFENQRLLAKLQVLQELLEERNK